MTELQRLKEIERIVNQDRELTDSDKGDIAVEVEALIHAAEEREQKLRPRQWTGVLRGQEQGQ